MPCARQATEKLVQPWPPTDEQATAATELLRCIFNVYASSPEAPAVAETAADVGAAIANVLSGRGAVGAQQVLQLAALQVLVPAPDAVATAAVATATKLDGGLAAFAEAVLEMVHAASAAATRSYAVAAEMGLCSERPPRLTGEVLLLRSRSPALTAWTIWSS